MKRQRTVGGGGGEGVSKKRGHTGPHGAALGRTHLHLKSSTVVSAAAPPPLEREGAIAAAGPSPPPPWRRTPDTTNVSDRVSSTLPARWAQVPSLDVAQLGCSISRNPRLASTKGMYLACCAGA